MDMDEQSTPTRTAAAAVAAEVLQAGASVDAVVHPALARIVQATVLFVVVNQTGAAAAVVAIAE